MNIWYQFCNWLPLDMLQWDFMKNALLAVLLMTPLFGLTSTMVVTGRMSFFSDALGHSAFSGIAIGSILGIFAPTWAAVLFSILFAILFCLVRRKSNHSADTLIGVFSSAAVAFGIFITTKGGSSFTKYNTYLIGDVLSVTPGQIGLLATVLVLVFLFWILFSNRLTLSTIHPQLASSRGIPTWLMETLFTVFLAVIVTLSISWVGLLILNSLLVLPAAAARNVAKNMRQYHLLSILFALIGGIVGLFICYYLSASAGACISLVMAMIFALSLCFRKVRT